jgi:hypothetical protein
MLNSDSEYSILGYVDPIFGNRGTFMKIQKTLMALGLIALLAGCGGGGGSAAAPVTTGVVTSTLSFPIASAWGAMIANGMTETFTISGTCSGTISLAAAAALGGATFEGVAGRLSAVQTTTGTLTNCTPASLASTKTVYYDSNYIPLGENTVDGDYGVYQTPPTVPPTALVGATGVVGTMTYYTDSSKSVSAGTQVTSYVMEADTASTAILNLVSKNYNVANVLTFTEQDRYRVTSTGAAVIISIDSQYANGSTTHLIFQ